jgi:hypothetical protein
MIKMPCLEVAMIGMVFTLLIYIFIIQGFASYYCCCFMARASQYKAPCQNLRVLLEISTSLGHIRGPGMWSSIGFHVCALNFPSKHQTFIIAGPSIPQMLSLWWVAWTWASFHVNVTMAALGSITCLLGSSFNTCPSHCISAWLGRALSCELLVLPNLTGDNWRCREDKQ